jgi:ectoine hydroxylase-related dioxygenase (phytanoyl-CoA dioxygenase family)
MEGKASQGLSAEQELFYRQKGYYFPIPVFDASEVGEFRARFDDHLARIQERLSRLLPRERHAVFGQMHASSYWVYRIVSHPRILDAVESILGPNLLVWESAWFVKLAKDKSYISWHQDGTYWSLNPPSVVTAWVALSESNPENGCMRVVPGTHKPPFLPQIETYGRDNALSRGQEIAVEVDETQAVNLVLRPGEMSLHHVAIIHGSAANNSDEPRIGLAIRYITPEVLQDAAERQLVLLVRGKDQYGHFDFIDPPKEGVENPEAQAEVLRRELSNLWPGQNRRR